ncbi:mandelate racemase/muconate lactonizing enzyme family protein [Alkalicoccobacillus gibsonii]|jgi:L-alanine-DL-glutamate epimerase-like enolase superfamily enzyme|uniref:mandelate racemase/muconate lactonizing enzyme family protein n=1 Tax=Alkalicoccobacillus gibsonii TaxID=79881 RepID=UPI001933EAF1|nr:mandelate racemase/muconate lactonizing enzyme family protein [Alkalicoccobacillus gibsonii]MBM0064831.1 mandelate racemase/muconate lactonizing enzyme family protein [Alkalicoccobacillus gibsonii]
MKITNVETYLLDVPLKQKAITDSQTRLESVEFVAVRIDTNEGISGWGFNWNYTKGSRAIQTIIDDTYAPALKGEDPLLHKSLMKKLHYTNHFIGQVGITRVALCAVNFALWDIRLKVANMPLWRYLGPAKEKVKAYNTDGGWLHTTTDELVRDMNALVERGFDAVKMKLGLPDPREDYERVKQVRQSIPKEVKLMVDVNTVWDLKTAMVWGRKLEEFDIYWLEEPMNPFNKTDHAKLAQALDVPIAVGETIYTKYDFREYIEAGAVDIIQADATKLSGIDEWLDVAALARCHDLEVIPHTNVQQKLHVQLAAASSNVPMVECCYESIMDIWEDPIQVVNGYYTLPEEPGLGCKLKDSVLKDCRIG